MRRLLLTTICLLLALVAGADDGLLVDDFEQGLRPQWQVKEFKGRTAYTVVTDGGSQVLQADSNAAASGLIFEQEFRPADYPILSWRWKIDGIVAGGDAGSKATDDYAARVYIIFPHWFYPSTTSLNYIWANRLEPGTIVANAYTGNAQMIAIDSGPARAGSWQTVRRNIVDDYRRAFGEEPPERAVVAIMTDSDNTGTEARAWYDDIRLHRAPASPSQ